MSPTVFQVKTNKHTKLKPCNPATQVQVFDSQLGVVGSLFDIPPMGNFRMSKTKVGEPSQEAFETEMTHKHENKKKHLVS